jgi:hypothetical protein
MGAAYQAIEEGGSHYGWKWGDNDAEDFASSSVERESTRIGIIDDVKGDHSGPLRITVPLGRMESGPGRVDGVQRVEFVRVIPQALEVRRVGQED